MRSGRAAGKGPGCAQRTAAAARRHQHAADDRGRGARAQCRAFPLPPTASSVAAERAAVRADDRHARQLAQGDAVVDGVSDTLEPMAAGGIPTAASLAQQLGAVEQGLAPASSGTGPRTGSSDAENLNNLITLHPVDEEAVPGEGAVRRCPPGVAAPGSAGAVAAIEAAGGAGQPPAKAWVASAEQRIAADAPPSTRCASTSRPWWPVRAERPDREGNISCFALSSSSSCRACSPGLRSGWSSIRAPCRCRWLDQELILSVGTVIVGLIVIGVLAVVIFELLRVVVGLPGSWRQRRGRRHPGARPTRS